MSRFIRQFLFGIFYLAIIVTVGFLVYVRYIKFTPSCTDGIQDQGEQGIDCGTVCGNSCPIAIQPIEVQKAALIFPATPGDVTFMGYLTNNNDEVGVVNVPYQFLAYDASATLLASISGNSFLYPGQNKIVAAVNVPVSGTIAFANLVVATSVSWTPSSTMGSAPLFAFQNETTASVASATIAANATFVNQDALPFQKVEIVALFRSSDGTIVGVSATELDNVVAGASVPITIPYPADARIDLSATVLDAYPLR